MTVILDGPIALVGSGEFTAAMADVDRALLEGRPRKVAHLPTAAAPEGEGRLTYWAELAAGHYSRLDAEVDTIPIVDRDSADDPALVRRMADAGLVYLSGGNPAYLADTLRDTRAWSAIVAAHRIGIPIAGCSAGAAALAAVAPDMRTLDMRPGLELVPGLAVIPHFDRMRHWWPAAEARHLEHAPDGVTVVGIDEDTALVGGRGRWWVRGRGTATRLHPGDPQTFGPDEDFRTG